MKADNFDLQAYLDRIGHTGAVAPDLATVSALMRRQLQTVPFENLDVLAGRGISLVPEAIVDKLVGRRRGGYCYEVNGLFALALGALGVAYRFVGCRPMIQAPVRRPRTHMAILATLAGEEWLCDVGFGSYGMRAPMRLAGAGPVRQDHDRFELGPLDAREYRLKAEVEGRWADQYSFDLGHHEWVDFMPANWLNSTYPESLFMRHRIVMRHTPDGRVILFDNRLKTIAPDGVGSRLLAEAEVADVLRDQFGLDGAL
ncbi:arylamine N-acetyltransferase [Parasulfuritortus cantonensis]|uniref:Arylamine N-acetyltransferase n=1 Tax=Parasulfuritortus cantonensis TaxID=2528202 RepID=A0A4R1BD39_9PROT|nr:arylamine N-acetyltransferase [Parasulfuritortus cantonensis]TCJ14980.1 arylamine N-acetyltransferase [Parasulfuritortus cantonensis]